ncbi:hypothetical protein CK215_24635 [Mesorhizobium sp. WSM3864]|nr:hypothetical protein CK215_24635 [Mesorhizobium sp. WSM3864]
MRSRSKLGWGFGLTATTRWSSRLTWACCAAIRIGEVDVVAGEFGLHAMRPHLDRFGISNSFCIPYPVLSHLGHALRNQFEVLQKQACGYRVYFRVRSHSGVPNLDRPSRAFEHVLSWLCRLRGR